MLYPALKTAHVALAAISIAGFAARGLLMIAGSPLLAARFTRVAPHVVDSALLATGVALAFVLGVSPHDAPWLAAKLIALLGYIVLGSVALRRGRSRRSRILALVGALALAAYIVVTALRHSPSPF